MLNQIINQIITVAVSLTFGILIGIGWMVITERSRRSGPVPKRTKAPIKGSNGKTSPVVKPEAMPEFRPPAKGDEHMVYPAKGNVKTGPGKPLSSNVRKLQSRVSILTEFCDMHGLGAEARALVEEIELEEAS